jgi:hypothetical protein
LLEVNDNLFFLKGCPRGKGEVNVGNGGDELAGVCAS